ncbi:MAG: ribosome silencing factor [Candidatus Promineifilaceae bacterium]
MVDTIVDRKGSDILLLDIRDQAVFADYFLICNGENERQLKALADHITEDAKKDGNVPVMGIEGEASSGWVLVDFGDLIVHLFSPQQRDYFRLEDIWDQARVVMHIQ